MATTKDEAINFRLGNDLLAGLRAIRERDGVPVSEQIRRAVEQWLMQRGVRGQNRRAKKEGHR